MIKYFLALTCLLSAGVSGLKYVDKRNVTTTLGKQYSCFYTIVYNATFVDKKKSSIVCTPNTNGGLVVEDFDLPGHGPIRLQHNVRKGKEQIKHVQPVDSMSVEMVPMNCSCSVPLDMLDDQTMAAGRMILKNRALTQSDDRLLFGPLLFFLLLSGQLTNLINAITGATATGRSLEMNNSEEVDRIMAAINSGDTEAALREDRTLLLSLLLTNLQNQIQAQLTAIQTQIQTAINNFLAALGLPATGRSLDLRNVDLSDESNDRTLLLTLLINSIRNQIQTAINNFLATLFPAAGRSLNRQLGSGLLGGSLLGSGGGLIGSGGGILGSGGLLGGGTGGDLGGLLGDSAGGDFGGLLAGLLGGDGSGDIGSLLGGDFESQLLGSLLGGAGTTDPTAALLDMLGVTEAEVAELMSFLDQLEQMSEEEFMTWMMTELGVDGNMMDMFNNIPLQCDCLPQPQ